MTNAFSISSSSPSNFFSPVNLTPPAGAANNYSADKRGRGRPPGSGNRHVLASLGNHNVFYFILFLHFDLIFSLILVNEI